jgi:hypothetical protein
MKFSEWFDDDLPDWSAIESEEDAEAGAIKRQELLLWGRKDTKTGKQTAVYLSSYSDCTVYVCRLGMGRALGPG